MECRHRAWIKVQSETRELEHTWSDGSHIAVCLECNKQLLISPHYGIMEIRKGPPGYGRWSP